MSEAGSDDFTSACYLGMHHQARALEPWHRLTTGVPAALAEPFSARAAAARLARLTGTERALLATSTLHVFFDLFVTLGAADLACYLDAGAYPIAAWGAERAAGRGARIRRFPHRDAVALRRMLRDTKRPGRRPVVVTDGMCPGCGLVAPVREYLRALRPYHGLLVLDDTQATGILGRAPEALPPYGHGGGGTMRFAGLTAPDVLVVGSLAKAFGVPVAYIAGAAAIVERFEQHSETRVHCSPPSLAHIAAARHALRVNAVRGDLLRKRLAGLVGRLRDGVRELGYQTGPSRFPVQSLESVPGVPPALLHRRLLEEGIQPVLHRPPCHPVATCSFLVTADHTPEQIDHLVAALGEAIKDLSPGASAAQGVFGTSGRTSASAPLPPEVLAR